MIPSPAFSLLSAGKTFQHPTHRPNELWQTDFTSLQVVGWGWDSLSTVLDDSSRDIVAWTLRTSMQASDVTETLDLARAKTGVDRVQIRHRPRLLSDTGPCSVSQELATSLDAHGLGHTRGAPYHPMTQGKLERSHRSMKNVVKLEYSDSPWELERAVVRFVDDSNHRRQHEALANVTPALDRHEQLVQMPDVTHPATSASERARIVGPEGLAPLSDRFGGHGDPAFREEIFDIAKAQTKAVSRPGELHPQPLVERHVSLSTHTAPIRRTTCRLTHGCVFIRISSWTVQLDTDKTTRRRPFAPSPLQRLHHYYERLRPSASYRCLGAQLAISVNNCPPPRDPRSRMTSVKRTQRKYVQKAYRVRNWREYETGLRARGSLTVWLGLTDGKLANWNSPRPTRRTPGRQRQYSNHAIETTVTLGLVFGLASRQTEGFLRSLLTLLNLDNDVPDHSTISRRKARLGKVASSERRTVKPVHLRIDSSGLSVHVGQWRTSPKARDYRKLHLAVDEQTSDVVACELTSKRARDASRVASLVGQIERPIASAKADAAYDTGDVYKTLENHRAHRSPKVLIPPRKGAQLALDSAGTRQRNRNIRARSRVGKRKWYVASGYSRRSKVETTFHRYKAILGSAMRARGLASQRVEVRLGCKILNTMTALGIPDGEMIG